MSLSAHKDDQMRVFIRFWSDNVPGKPILRHLRLVNDFCSQMLRREYCQANDYVHIPPQYDKEHQRCWMIFDLNVKEPGLDLGRIPLSCFSVTYFGDQAV